MKSNFDRALARVLAYEGGKVDLKADPGGRTNQGVIQRVYDGYRSRKGLAKRDVYLMVDAERDEIYRIQYWDAIKGDDLPAGIDLVVFDGAVNSGPSQAVKWLQRALGGVVVDGVLGQATLAAALADGNNDALVDRICDRRMAFLRALKTWGTFGKGWTRRVADVRTAGKAWATGLIAADPEAVEDAAARASIEDAKSIPRTGTASAIASGGVVSAGIAQATDALQPLASFIPNVATAITVLTAVGALAAVGAGIWIGWARAAGKERADALDLTVPA